jgi:exonuclease V gamma subunit
MLEEQIKFRVKIQESRFEISEIIQFLKIPNLYSRIKIFFDKFLQSSFSDNRMLKLEFF